MGDPAIVTGLKVNVSGLRRDVEDLNSTEMSMLLFTIDILVVPRVDVPTN